ncbi:MAG: EpsI family protein [Pseudomonadota bacterium]|jgi:EpsI family protein
MTLNRRDLLAGLACAGALGAAEWLRPRTPVVLMPAGGKLTTLVPDQLGPWMQGREGDIVVPRTEGSLASRLYGDQLARIYYRADQRDLPMMLSIAYGFRQSDALQLHRPEACYPAVGFTVGPPRALTLVLGDRTVPAVALTATVRDRVEDLIYWTRMGRRFPRSEAEQREMRFANAIEGLVPDGALVRASAVRINPEIPVFGEVEGFLRALAGALGHDGRKVLLAAA